MTEAKKRAGFATRAIHDGQAPDEVTGAVNVPIYLTSTYQQEEIGKNKGHEYARLTNPTRDALEESLCSLEGGTSAHVFGSGMAAITALCTMMKSGDHVVCSDNVYGGTGRLFDKVLTNYGLTFTYVDTSVAENVAAAITPATKLVHIETPTNPMMSLTDIGAVARICHAKGVELSVDNTFLSPYLQQPIALGADIVMHSTTKFLNGHSDGLGGVLICTKPEHAETFRFVQKCTGGILSPFESYLLLRGVKTLAVRMKQHDANGRVVADFLKGHAKVQQVFYPGLVEHPQHELAKRQQHGFGSMISMELGSLEKANRFAKALRLGLLAESLGGVETLICHPATMTHAAVGAEGRARLGITDGLMRVSVGIEDVEDIVADLGQALDKI
ncbi:PLP-dependent aspartate aminotransferase family protein [Tunturiibacter empetritectus]|uniref:Cystathionine gamma-lyase/cystathionine beta-lyase/cystathionine gamma-lyase/homocysteine desulfhydrase n=2 Tax=Tunturiibacter TaxID=3154218 RepID=A0A852VFS9_9BACT|nr:PLP-dependent aspartate aminotransferase family protein [Edaphobacter lichenicola]NYF90500.1 cystathionine gamma-lyase/cystathionine beta-lyase/cystathionine gamma-lyase/homocysteine desulfhydrase [Edaphobacter lichenicola]